MNRLWLLILLLPALPATAQIKTAPDRYFIQFTDKNNNPYSPDRPGEFLSERALQRRQRQGIKIDQTDLPVTPDYPDSLEALGLKVINRSKWFNAATVYSKDSLLIDTLHRLSFIKKPRVVKAASYDDKPRHYPKFGFLNTEEPLDYGGSSRQIEIMNGHFLHDQGYRGEGIHIAVIDAGFLNTDLLPAFDSLWANDQVLGWRNFVHDSISIFDSHYHGMSVLSIIGGNIPGELIGTAPKAKFWLLRSEDVSSEYLIEEDNWIAAIEFSDSAGVDVVNTSLGYSTFDDPRQNHSYRDMDGNTTRVSVASSLAASKGMLIVNSAGNEGAKSWKYITAPADAENILAAGSVDARGNIAVTSSRGPSSDGRVKPDIVAMGHGTYHQSYRGIVETGSGTSFAAPLISGMAACLWQANPDAGIPDILSTIKKSADRYYHPDSIYGYGLPDFFKAHLMLQMQFNNTSDDELTLHVFPNPSEKYFYAGFSSLNAGTLNAKIFDLSGKILYHKEITAEKGYNLIMIDDTGKLSSGTYIFQINPDNKILREKIIKY